MYWRWTRDCDGSGEYELGFLTTEDTEVTEKLVSSVFSVSSVVKKGSAMEIRRVGVLGCGLMGSGIAQVAATAGFEVTVLEVEQRYLDKGFAGNPSARG